MAGRDQSQKIAVDAELLPVAGLERARGHDFVLEPDADDRAAIAGELGLSGLKKLRFAGRISPEGEGDFAMTATLGATVIQPCVVTLAPVTTRIDEEVSRRWLADMPPLPEADEIEMPDDDTADPLGERIDLRTAMIEALALALPAYPRAEGVAPVEIGAAPPEAEQAEEPENPFAALKALRDGMQDDED